MSSRYATQKKLRILPLCEREQTVFMLEIKPKENQDCLKHPDFVKLGNLLKDEVDRLALSNCSEDITVYGMLIGGRYVNIFGMDLLYTGIYRLFDVGFFNLPTSSADIMVLDHAFDCMFSLMDLLGVTTKKVLNFLKQENEPRTPTLRRHLVVKSFNSPTKHNY